MARMKTFLMYALVLIGFIFLSSVLEDGFVMGMYNKIEGKANSGSYNGIEVTGLEGRATSVNGYLTFKIKNTTGNTVNCYGKIDLYSEQDLLAATEYIEILDFKPQEEKTYQVKFKANDIAYYDVSLVSELPDKSNIINILGWEIDLTNVFGMDLSNLTVFGVKLTDLFSWDNIKTAGGNAWSWFKLLLESVPWWGYAIGAGIVLWHLPKGYLFGIFPL